MKFYDLSKILSFNRILNFIVGARGLGKTYGVKKFVIRQFLKGNGQFIYLRRYKTELKKVGKFFDDVCTDPEFEGVKFEVKGMTLYINKKIAGYALPLSSWQTEKSNAYPQVTTVIFDEFIREKDMGRYLPNEVSSFLNIMDTIIRNRDDARAICMSNAVTITNPYFVYFKLIPDINKQFHKTKSIALEIANGEDFTSERLKTRFGQLIDGTDYAEMAIKNKFTADTYDFIEKRSKESKFLFAITYNKKTLGVWYDTSSMYLSKQYDSSTRLHYVVRKEDMKENTKYVHSKKDSYHLLKFESAFSKGLLRFDDLEVRNVGYDILNRL